MQSSTTTLVAFAAVLLLTIGPQQSAGVAEAAHGNFPGRASAFSIDLEPFADESNTATSLGSREECATMTPNGVQDNDEDAPDSITLDVTVTDIPETHPMLAFSFTLVTDETAFTVTDGDVGYLLAANQGSQLFDASAQERDGWTATALDIGLGDPESGSGVLARIQMLVTEAADPGLYVLRLTAAAHADPLNNAQAPAAAEAAIIAVDMDCPPGPDSDADGVSDIDELACGGEPLDSEVRPEVLGNGIDDNDNGRIDETVDYNGTYYFDCDGDGYSGYVERHVYAAHFFGGNLTANQRPCGTAGPAPWFYGLGWPADLASGSSANRIDIADLGAFVTPVRRLDTSQGDADFHTRFDLVPDNQIDLRDLSSLATVAPPMLNGARALNGPPCPFTRQ